jgi:hypothetical protein
MNANLRLVSSNPQRISRRRHDGAALRHLALRLSGHVRAGNTGFACAVAGVETLTPIEMGIVSAWMAKSGVAESQILAVMVGESAGLRAALAHSA